MVDAVTNRLPIMGPVQEKETNPRVKAIKKIPRNPPRSACLSILFTQEAGNWISKAPKKEKAKRTNIPKNKRFIHTFVERSFNPSGPVAAVKATPTYKVSTGGDTTSNADVLKSIVALIASINKQIQALQKLILKR